MSNVYYKLYYHIIWGTKKRGELIDDDIDELLKRFVAEKIKKLGGGVLEFNTHINHCHLLVTIPPKLNISEFVGEVKGYSSHEINIRRNEKPIQWQRGYGILSSSEKGIPFIKKYIQNQKYHHRNKSTIDIMEFSPEE